MKFENINSFPISLFLTRSSGSTAANKTGSWSIMQPRYQEKTAPCSVRCPCGEDIPLIEMLASRGDFAAAWRTILSENPLPGVCGRVCFRPCEDACNRGEFDAPVSINALERFMADSALAAEAPDDLTTLPKTGKRIAIAGSGPAGLAAGFFLARLGHDCEIFEAENEPGGVLRHGIPAYRLPADVLNREISRIEALGVRIICSRRIDADFLKTAKNKYDALFVGCGNGRPIALNIPGGEYAIDGLAFLKMARRKRMAAAATDTGGAVAGASAAIIGGGNSAIDVARTLLRFGATPTIVYRRRREDMPAYAHEITRAVEEGVRIIELSAPLSIHAAGTEFELTIQKMRITDPGRDGRMQTVPIPGETERLTVAAVYSAIGAKPEAPWMTPEDTGQTLRLSHSSAHLEEADGLPVIWGGDLVNEEESVADAIASGKQAAIILDTLFRKGMAAVKPAIARCGIGDGKALSMEMYLGGTRADRSRRVVKFSEINQDYFDHSLRERGGALAASASTASFEEVECALAAGKAISQAGRCFNCGICNDCDNCRTFCPEVAVHVNGSAGPATSLHPGPARQVNTDYCKGCGICVTECPRCAMIMEEPEL